MLTSSLWKYFIKLKKRKKKTEKKTIQHSIPILWSACISFPKHKFQLTQAFPACSLDVWHTAILCRHSQFAPNLNIRLKQFPWQMQHGQQKKKPPPQHRTAANRWWLIKKNLHGIQRPSQPANQTARASLSKQWETAIPRENHILSYWARLAGRKEPRGSEKCAVHWGAVLLRHTPACNASAGDPLGGNMKKGLTKCRLGGYGVIETSKKSAIKELWLEAKVSKLCITPTWSYGLVQ